MVNVNPLAYATVRTGKLISVPIEIKNVHPERWDWFQGAFGLGWRQFAGLEDDGLFHEIRMDYEHLMGVWHKKSPKKVIVQFTPNHFKYEKKGGLRVMYKSHSVYLKNIHKLFFEDYETKERFEISNYENTMDYFQPPTENVQAYWRFNPYAVFGTGYKDWCNPYRVHIITNGICLESDETYGPESGNDWQMYHCIQPSNKKEHLKDLSEYTGINFLKQNEVICL